MDNMTITGAAWLEKLNSGSATEDEKTYYKSVFQELCEKYKAKHGAWPTQVEFNHLFVPTLESARASGKAA